jgi:SAM-dependent methyltransferase
VTYPVPGQAELDAAYGGFYRPGSGRLSFGADPLLAGIRAAVVLRAIATAPPGPVLDVGSGDGALLDALAARGYEAVGLERAQNGRDDVVAAELTSFDARRGAWAAVVMWHSLEHLRDGAAALDHAAGLLAPGGLLIIAAPNRDSWQARVLGDRWLALDLPRHLTHLTTPALLARLRRDGLVVERVSFWQGGQVLFGWLHGLVGRLPGRPDLYDAIRRPEARAVAITARRRALTLAAGLGLAPLAGLLSVAEVLAGHGGSVLVQARLAPVDGHADAAESTRAAAR